MVSASVDQLEAAQAELSRVKEVAKRLGYSLEILTERYGHLGASKENLTEFANLMNKEK